MNGMTTGFSDGSRLERSWRVVLPQREGRAGDPVSGWWDGWRTYGGEIQLSGFGLKE